jgi:ribosomal protein S11
MNGPRDATVVISEDPAHASDVMYWSETLGMVEDREDATNYAADEVADVVAYLEQIGYKHVRAVTRRFYWTIGWNWVGGDCGGLPGEFGTEQAAQSAGEEWVAEAKAQTLESGEMTEQEWDEGAGSYDGTASYWLYFHEVAEDGSEKIYGEDGKLVR